MSEYVEEKIPSKFREDELINELYDYVYHTYDEHYSQTNIETMEIAEDDDLGIPYCKMNIIKYARRYGKKGNSDAMRKDVMKILHYALYLLYFHDKEEAKTQQDREDYITKGNVDESNMEDIPTSGPTIEWNRSSSDVDRIRAKIEQDDIEWKKWWKKWNPTGLGNEEI